MEERSPQEDLCSSFNHQSHVREWRIQYYRSSESSWKLREDEEVHVEVQLRNQLSTSKLYSLPLRRHHFSLECRSRALDHAPPCQVEQELEDTTISICWRGVHLSLTLACSWPKGISAAPHISLLKPQELSGNYFVSGELEGCSPVPKHRKSVIKKWNSKPW
jgi:hypothetical protein